MLTLNNVCFAYTPEKPILKSVNLHIPEGCFFGLLGENGAGKTTLIELINSMLLLQEGSISIDNMDLKTQTKACKSMLGWVPQEFNFNGFQPILYMLNNVAGYYGIPRQQAMVRIQHLLTTLGLWDRRHMKIQQLSGGLKRRLMIIRALLHSPKLLLLDEPTVGVDIQMREATWAFLEQLNQEEGVSIVLTTHYLEEVERLCQKVAVLDKGQIIKQGDLQQLLQGVSQEVTFFQLKTPLPKNLVVPGQLTSASETSPLSVVVNEANPLQSVLQHLQQHGALVERIWQEQTRLANLLKEWTRS